MRAQARLEVESTTPANETSTLYPGREKAYVLACILAKG